MRSLLKLAWLGLILTVALAGFLAEPGLAQEDSTEPSTCIENLVGITDVLMVELEPGVRNLLITGRADTPPKLFRFKSDAYLAAMGRTRAALVFFSCSFAKGYRPLDSSVLSEVPTELHKPGFGKESLQLQFDEEAVDRLVTLGYGQQAQIYFRGVPPVDTAGAAEAYPIPKLFNTGVDDAGQVLAQGAEDQHFALTAPSGPAFALIHSLPPAWISPPPGSAWIGPDGGNLQGPAGEYSYSLTFDLTNLDPATVEVSGSWATDNSAIVLINGASTGVTKGLYGFSSIDPFRISDGFVEGENTLTFVVTNVPPNPSPTGLLITNLQVAPVLGTITVSVGQNEPALLPLVAPSTVLVLDSSQSMWGRVDGKPKYLIARDVMSRVIDEIPGGTPVGLRLYGHRFEPAAPDACEDAELVVPLGPVDKRRLSEVVQALRPQGNTPIAYALRQVAGDLAGVAGDKRVVVVTDGIPECDKDVEAALAFLEGEGFTEDQVQFLFVAFAISRDAILEALGVAAGRENVAVISAEDEAGLFEALRGATAVSFAVLNDAGDEVAVGVVGSTEVELPAGVYTVVIDPQGSGVRIPEVTVTPAQTTAIELVEEGGEIRHRVSPP